MSFLVRLAVGAQAELDRRKRKEEEEKAKKAKEAKESSKQFLDQLRATAWRELEERLDSGGASSKRKRKKRRKRRTPRTSSRSSCGRSRRRQRQWLACNAGFPGDVPLRAVFPSVVVWPEMRGIMAGMDQMDSGALIVDSGSIVCNARFAGSSQLFVFPLFVGRPAGRSVWTRCTFTQLDCFTGDDAPRAVLPFIVVVFMMFGIMAGTGQVPRGVQKNWAWEMTSYVSVFCSLVRQWMHKFLSVFRGLVSDCNKLRILRSCSPSRSSTSLSWRTGSSPWSRLFTRPQRFRSCCSFFGRRCPCCAGSCRFSGAAVETHSCSSLGNLCLVTFPCIW